MQTQVGGVVLEAKEQKSNIHWLLDVDDTLMVMDENGEFIFNHEFIDLLLKWGVKEVTLLTKMDARHNTFNSKIRIPLIEYLESKGIKVVKVITTVDVSCKKTVSNPDAMQTGYAYETLMKPVEKALLKAKQTNISRESFNKLEQQVTNQNILKTLEFILNAKLVNPSDKIPSKKEEKLLVQKIENYLAADKGEAKLDEVDFFFTIDQFTEELSRLSPVNTTFQDALDKWKTQVGLAEKIPDVVQEFFAERLKYRNQSYRMHLKAEGMDYKKDAGENGKGPKENTKGQAYALWVDENALTSSSAVIFVDDSRRELESVNQSHAQRNYKHRICTKYPPYSEKTIFKKHTNSCRMDLKLFEVDMDIMIAMIPSFVARDKKTLAQAEINYLFNRVRDLNERGVRAVKERKFNIAIGCFEISYLISEHAQLTKEIITGLIINVAKAKNDAGALGKSSRPKFGDNDLQLDSLYQALINLPGADMQLKKIEMDYLVFQQANPFLEKPSPSRKETDPEFKEFNNRIIEKIQWLTVTYPVIHEKCVAFLTSLKAKIVPQRYKDCVQKAIDRLPVLIQEEQARTTQKTIPIAAPR